ncbi:hypothetical protein BAE44_0014813 [Dichanthelium oligosanthes]|uniref:Uncharacterized protein n=1 Tax=Dichanthelium oligosanthes TaxID=888268 RepID=A0A1E5VGD2_9POAL|nr:hypothetical protein BAE44_0014813 [Dichanthelium oligosanthes]
MATPTPLLVSSSSCRCLYPRPRRRHRHLPGRPKPDALPALPSSSLSLRASRAAPLAPHPRRRRDVSAAYGDGDMDDEFGDFDADDADGVGDDDDVDKEVDYDVDYDRLLAPVAGFPPPGPAALAGEEGDIAMVAADSFVSTQDSASDTVVDYAVDEDEFHKIRLLHCDFLIRKVPDPDDDVFDFREMYVTPPDTDIYSIPRVLAPMPQKVSVPEGKKRDRRNDLLLIRDGGESFRIIFKTKRDDATTVIQREEWAKSRHDVEKHFRKLRDFDYSNWF